MVACVRQASCVCRFYFVREQGESEFWWMRITPDGDRLDITPPTKCDTSLPLPSADSPPGESDADPRVHRLVADDLGCCIKVVCRPFRNDGEGVRTTRGAVAQLCVLAAS